MGLSVAGALIAITLSWLGQSPKLLRRMGLGSLKLNLRVRAFTGYALALLLLATAFFLAGVPLGNSAENDTPAGQEAEVAVEPDSSPGATRGSTRTEASPTPSGLSATPATPETGAFSGPPTAEDASEASPAPEDNEDSVGIRSTSPVTQTDSAISTPEITEPTLGSTETETPVPSATALPTATPSPTETPLPTLTPTAIVGPTAVIETGGSTIWLKRSPGGQNMVLVRDGEVVLVLARRANQNGILWREVATVDGVEGWLQQEFVILSDS